MLSQSLFAAKAKKTNTKTKTKAKETALVLPDTIVLDLSDSSLPLGSKLYYYQNDDGSYSSYSLYLDYTDYLFGLFPKKGKEIRLTGKIKSNKDLPYLSIGFKDNENNILVTDNIILRDLYADEKQSFDLTFQVLNEPKKNLTLVLIYELTSSNESDFQKIIEDVNLSFERKENSTDFYSLANPSGIKWSCDITDADYNGDVRNFKREPWDSSIYCSDLPYSVIFAGSEVEKGDLIEFYFKGTSDTDIPSLNVSIFDSNYKEVSKTITLCNIKAGKTFFARIFAPIDVENLNKFIVRFFYDASWQSEPKVGKNVKINMERTISSFDVSQMMAKKGKPNSSKIYNIDFYDNTSYCGNAFEMQYDKSEWAKCYKPNGSRLYGGDSLVFRSYLKGDLPKKGDYIIFNYKIVSDIDIPSLDFFIYSGGKNGDYDVVDNSFFNVTLTKGIPSFGKTACRMIKNAPYDLEVIIRYDASVGKNANIKFERVCETTQTIAKREAKTYNIDISKKAAQIKLEGLDKNQANTSDRKSVV